MPTSCKYPNTVWKNTRSWRLPHLSVCDPLLFFCMTKPQWEWEDQDLQHHLKFAGNQSSDVLCRLNWLRLSYEIMYIDKAGLFGSCWTILNCLSCIYVHSWVGAGPIIGVAMHERARYYKKQPSYGSCYIIFLLIEGFLMLIGLAFLLNYMKEGTMNILNLRHSF